DLRISPPGTKCGIPRKTKNRSAAARRKSLSTFTCFSDRLLAPSPRGEGWGEGSIAATPPLESNESPRETMASVKAVAPLTTSSLSLGRGLGWVDENWGFTELEGRFRDACFCCAR